MNKEFVPYEPSLALKELGFDEPCFANYTVIPEDKINWFTIPEQGITDKTSFGSSKNYNSKSFEEEGTISAPLYSQAFRWFREKYDLFGVVEGKGYDYKRYYVYSINGKWHPSRPGLDTYEEAELACLIKLIEIVKDNE
jgi:hypothetical protein